MYTFFIIVLILGGYFTIAHIPGLEPYPNWKWPLNLLRFCWNSFRMWLRGI